MKTTIIFYPSGYLQLQAENDGDDFCHLYDNPVNLAKDAARLLGGDNTIGWYGNDPDAWLDLDNTPGVRFADLSELEANAKAAASNDNLWDNEKAFYLALASILGQ